MLLAALGGSLPSLVRAQAGKSEGSVMAPVVIEVFSDFQCPGCKQLHEGTLRQLRDEFVRQSKVRVVHREFPLPMHKYAKQAASLACAAEKLGKYHTVADALFRDQQKWSDNGKYEDCLKQVLAPADFAKLIALAKDPKVMAEVDADVARGKAIAVGSTPTMILTVKGAAQPPVSGAVSYAILKRYIESVLSQ